MDQELTSWSCTLTLSSQRMALPAKIPVVYWCHLREGHPFAIPWVYFLYFGKSRTIGTFMLTSEECPYNSERQDPSALKTTPLTALCRLSSNTFFLSLSSYVTLCTFASYPKEAALQSLFEVWNLTSVLSPVPSSVKFHISQKASPNIQHFPWQTFILYTVNLILGFEFASLFSPKLRKAKIRLFFFHLTSVMCYLKATKTCKIFKDCKTKCVLKWRNHQTLRFDVPMQLTVSMPLAGHALLACVWPHKSRIFYFLTKWAFL